MTENGETYRLPAYPEAKDATDCPAPALSPKRLIGCGEVAKLFSVDPKTVTRWANEGKLSVQRTLGGHRRYLESEVQALLQQRLERIAPHGT